MTEKDKLHTGELYLPGDEDIMREKTGDEKTEDGSGEDRGRFCVLIN